jgi:hypothetical protein
MYLLRFLGVRSTKPNAINSPERTKSADRYIKRLLKKILVSNKKKLQKK